MINVAKPQVSYLLLYREQGYSVASQRDFPGRRVKKQRVSRSQRSFDLVLVVPKSALRGVVLKTEQVVEALLGGVDPGEHAPGTGAPRSP